MNIKTNIKEMIAKVNNIKIFKINLNLLIIHVVSLIALVFLTHSVISYAKGEFEIPFFPREDDGASDVEISMNPLNRPTENPTEEPTEEISSLIDVMNPGVLFSASGMIEETTDADDDFINAADFDENDFNASMENIGAPSDPPEDSKPADSEDSADLVGVFELYSNSMRNAGFTVTDGIYEPYIENSGQQYEYKFVKITPQYTTIPKSQSIAIGDLRKNIVEPIMDYFIIRWGDREILCGASGRVIDQNFARSGLQILKMRDSSGRTVFKRSNKYYIYDAGFNRYVEIEFDEDLGNRGIPFMYASYYGVPHGSSYAFKSENGMWGYMYADTNMPTVWASYHRTFNYSEVELSATTKINIGIAYYYQWRRGNQLYFYNEDGAIINYKYFGPDTELIDASHLGFFYFDHGLTRVYEREFVWRGNFPSTDSEREFLVDVYGKEFYIPEDYTIRTYSNGMILLEKDGYFGFMNYLGEWKVQPIFTYAQPFYEGIAVIGYNGKKALIDTKGNLITKLKYDYISNCTGGIVALYERGVGWTILNKVRRTIE